MMTWFSGLLLEHFQWTLGLYRKLFKHQPRCTLAVVIGTLVSQFSMLFAFFLPLKVIILVGSPEVPSYFPGSLAEMQQAHLVVLLGGGAAFCFLLHQVAEYFIQRYSESGSERMLAHTRKLALFTDQSEVAKRAYQRLAGNLAAYLFVLLAWGLFAVIYPPFLAVMLGYLVTAGLAVGLAGECSLGWRQRMQRNAAPLITLLAGLGFMILFGFMVFDYLTTAQTGIIAAVVSLLLSRQVFQRLSDAIKGAINLSRQRPRIDAMFTHDRQLDLSDTGHVHSLARALLDPDAQKTRLEGLVHHHFAQQPLVAHWKAEDLVLEDYAWQQTGLPGMMAFHLRLRHAPDNAQCQLKLHLFHPKQSTFARNESDLLSFQGGVLPGFELHSVNEYEGFHVHWFIIPELARVPADAFRRQQPALLACCWQREVSPALLDSYRRTHLQLPQRLSMLLDESLEGATPSDNQARDLQRFRRAWPTMNERLHELPSVIVNRDVTNHDALYTIGHRDDVDAYRVALWGRWVLEPLGSHYPVSREALERLPELLAKAAHTNPALGKVGVEQVELVARLHSLEAQLNKQKYRSALEQLPDILACQERIDEASHHAA